MGNCPGAVVVLVIFSVSRKYICSSCDDCYDYFCCNCCYCSQHHHRRRRHAVHHLYTASVPCVFHSYFLSLPSLALGHRARLLVLSRSIINNVVFIRCNCSKFFIYIHTSVCLWNVCCRCILFRRTNMKSRINLWRPARAPRGRLEWRHEQARMAPSSAKWDGEDGRVFSDALVSN